MLSFPTRRSSDLSDEALRVMAKFRVPAGLKIELWAAEPMLANPVALTFDEHGRCYVERERDRVGERSEEHTSELQSPYDLVCRLLLEKKKFTNMKKRFRFLAQWFVGHIFYRLIHPSRVRGVLDISDSRLSSNDIFQP